MARCVSVGFSRSKEVNISIRWVWPIFPQYLFDASNEVCIRSSLAIDVSIAREPSFEAECQVTNVVGADFVREKGNALLGHPQLAVSAVVLRRYQLRYVIGRKGQVSINAHMPNAPLCVAMHTQTVRIGKAHIGEVRRTAPNAVKSGWIKQPQWPH